MTNSIHFNHPQFKERRSKLRNEAPKAEIILWQHLKGKQINNCKFRRQYGVGPFVVDFYCHKLKLAIELDGDSHFEEGAQDYDKRRQQYIEKHNIQFIRFTNTDIYECLDGVIQDIECRVNEISEKH